MSLRDWFPRVADAFQTHLVALQLVPPPVASKALAVLPVELPPADLVTVERHPRRLVDAVDEAPDYQEGQSGRWHFRGTILDRLDEYFVCIRRLRQLDARAYDLFSRVGFTVSADRFLNPEHPAYQQFQVRASLGGCLMPRTADDDMVIPSFMYFERMVRAPLVQPFPGTIYKLSALYDDRSRAHRWASRQRTVVVCHIGVEDGRCTLLRERVHTTRVVRPSRGKRRDTIVLHGHAWDYPRWLYDGLEDRHARRQDCRTVEEWAVHLFGMAVLTYQSCIEKIVIRVEHHGCHAAFGLDVARGKYFFADRDVTVLTPSGRKKPIFHAVREHLRQLASGAATTVRDHYRGLRDFDWKGYRIHIVLPAQRPVLELPLLGQEWIIGQEREPDPVPGYANVTLKRAGELLSDALER